MTEVDDADPRRALGRRAPAPTLPKLQLNEAFLASDPAVDIAPLSPSSDLASPRRSTDERPASPRSPGGGRKAFRKPTVARPRKSANRSEPPKGLTENRKLLAHLLGRLEARSKPPDLLSVANIGAQAAGQTRRNETGSLGSRIGQVVVGAAQSGIDLGHRQSSFLPNNGEHEDEHELDGPAHGASGHHHIEDTFDLIDQMRGLLALAYRQGLDLFDVEDEVEDSPTTPSRSKAKTGRLSAITSPITSKRPLSPRGSPSRLPSTVLSGGSLHRRLCLVLQDVIHDDCVHQMPHFRPSHPPNALQAACLDLATFLYHVGNVEVKIGMTSLVLDALYTMPETMLYRLHVWLDRRLQQLLDLSVKLRGLDLRDRHAVEHRGVRATQSMASDDDRHVLMISGLLSKVITMTCDMATRSLDENVQTLVTGIMSRIRNAKPDLALDLLQAVAFAEPGPRQIALRMLHEHWPNATGHNVIARRVFSDCDSATRPEGKPEHHFIPWRISSHDPLPDPNKHCLVCEAEIHGFCVRCSMCSEQCHLHCLRADTEVLTFEIMQLSAKGALAPRTVHIKYSRTPARNGGKGGSGSDELQIGQHSLHRVNLFTTTLCSACRDPLWGTNLQAYVCAAGCQQMYHRRCLSTLRSASALGCRPGRHVMINDIVNASASLDPFSISLERLQESFRRDQGWLDLSRSDLEARTFDEVAVLHGALWLQYKMLDHGLGSGCLSVVAPDGQQTTPNDILGLRSALKRYDAALKVLAANASSAAIDFAHAVGVATPPSTGYIFSRHFLTYCTALLRSPSGSRGTDLLNPFDETDSPDVESSGAVEVMSFPSVLAGLSKDLGLHQERIGRHFVAQLQSIGLCDLQHVDEQGDERAEPLVHFTLPLLMDASPTVELLILAIEALLVDLDLSMNEQAFIWLTTRAWPSLLCSPYALERLGGAVVNWIMNEDECLHELIKSYASQHKALPGVRAASTSGAGFGGTSSVPLYTSDRSRILDMYAKPWLSALEQQDSEVFIHMIYDQSRSSPDQRPANDANEREAMALRIADRALERLTTAVQSGIIEGSQHSLVVAWLEDVGDLSSSDHPFRALPRLLHYKQSGAPETDDIWDALTRADAADDGDLSAWTRILAVSGVEVPETAMSLVVARLDSNTSSLSTYRNVIATVANNPAVLAPTRFATTCCDVFERLSLRLLGSQNPDVAEEEEASLTDGLLLMLRAYGVESDALNGTSLPDCSMVDIRRDAGSAKRRRLTIVDQQIAMSKSAVLSVLTLLGESRFPKDKLIDWLWLISTKATIVSNVDGFLHDIATQMFDKLWPLLPSSHLRPAIMRLFTRLLTVAAQPLSRSVQKRLHSDRSETRLILHAFLLGLFDSTVFGESPCATPGAVAMTMLLFDDVLDAETDTPDISAFSKSLLPTQLAAISRLFSEQLARSDDESRISILSRLAHYRRALPHWPILPWATIEELLLEQTSAVAQITAWRGSQSGSALAETLLVRASLIALGLDMLASNIEISWTAVQRFQQHVAAACALPWSTPNDGIVNLVLPALRNVLDAPRHLWSSGPSRRSVLVGTLFVPVIIDFGNELKRHDHPTQRQLLDVLHVTMHKQDTRPVELAALGALQTVADYAAAVDRSTENRLLALRVISTALSRMEAQSLLRISPPIFSAVSRAMVGQLTENGDTAIAESCRTLLKTMIRLFGRSGMFVQVFKVDSVNAQWGQSNSSLLHKSLQLMTSGDDGATILDTLFGDIAEVLKRDPDALQHMLDSLQTFTTVNEIEISEDAAENFGLLLSRVTKHITELDEADFRPDSLLNVCRHLLDRIPPVSIPPILSQSSTLLLVALLRFDVQHETVSSLLEQSAKVATRAGIENTVRMVVLEDGVRRGLYESAMTPSSMTTILRCITEASRRDPALRITQQAITDSSAACVSILARQHPALVTVSEAQASLTLRACAAALLLQSQRVSVGTLESHLSTLSEQAAQIRCELCAQLLLVAEPGDDLTSLFPIMARSTSLCLRAAGDFLSVTDTSGDGADLLATVYDIVRLVTSGGDAPAIEAYWERIWPDWHRLVTLSTETQCVNQPLRTVSHSVFFDLITFLGSIGSTILVAHAEVIIETLSVADKWMKANAGAGSAKLERTKQTLSAAGQTIAATHLDDTKDAVKADMLASEKLKILRNRH